MTRSVLAVLALLAVPAAAVAADAPASLRDAASVPAPPAADAWRAPADGASDTGATISPAKAALYSLLLPGLGDYKLGHRGRAAAFFAAEGGIWLAYGVFQAQGHSREDEYEALAVRFAGVGRTGHSDEFYARLREYDNSDVYEADVKDEGRFDLKRVLTNAELEQYFIENRVADYEPWRWRSREYRLQYSETRSSSKTSYRRADYMLAAAALNRVASAIVSFASARTASAPQSVGYRVHLAPSARGMDVAVSVTRTF